MIKKSLLALGLLCGFAAASLAADRKPNILIFSADDLGYADCSIYGSKDISTPNIDALARSGVRFSNGYASAPVCSPSRAGFITGRYQARFGFDANAESVSVPGRDPKALDLHQVTFAQRFKSLGYATGIVGKWHLGAGEGYLPTQRGFDSFYGFLPFGIGAQAPNGPSIYRDTTVVEKPKNHMEQFATEALAFIDHHQATPFFLYLPFSAVHAPYVGAKPYVSDADDNLVPASRRKYAADLRQMDDIIGRIVARLRERGLEDDTLIFFYSDNGGTGGASRNTPLRGTKWTLWEGGIRVPFIVSWKGRIPGDRVINTPVIETDVLPTSIAAADTTIDPSWKLDGVNLLPLLEGKETSLARDELYWRFGIQYAIRKGDWKLVKAHISTPPRLFNLAHDIGEDTDLADKHPEKVRALQLLWDAWNTQNEPPRWNDDRWNGDGDKKKKTTSKKDDDKE